MRSHSKIIEDVGAATLIERANLPVSIHTVRSWRQRDSIPAEYWATLNEKGIASLTELAEAARPRQPRSKAA